MKHKIGIIGYGNMGSWHAENIRDRIEELDEKLLPYKEKAESINKNKVITTATCNMVTMGFSSIK